MPRASRAQRPGPVRRAGRPVVAARRRVRRAALAGRLPRRAHPAGAAPRRGAGRPGLRRRADGARTSAGWATGTSGVDLGLRGLRAGPRARRAPGARLGAGGAAGRRLRRRGRWPGRSSSTSRTTSASSPSAPGCCGPAARWSLDALAAGRLSTLVNVHLLERLPGGPPRGLHDPALFVDRDAAARRGRPAGPGPASWWACGRRCARRSAWALGRRAAVRMKPIRSTAVVFAGYGRKR